MGDSTQDREKETWEKLCTKIVHVQYLTLSNNFNAKY